VTTDPGPPPLEGATTPAASSPATVEGAPRTDLQHKSHAPRTVSFMVITVSDSRTADTDTSGQLIGRLLLEAGHRVARYALAKDEAAQVEAAILEGLDDADVQILVLNGGTGMSIRDGTFEVVSRLLEKRIDGFGELFRMLSWDQVGSAAMMSRAVAGTCRGKAIFSIPGSPRAAELALKSLIIPEAGHLVFEVHR